MSLQLGKVSLHFAKLQGLFAGLQWFLGELTQCLPKKVY